MEKLNKYLTDPDYDCRLVIQLNFADTLIAKLSARNKALVGNEWSVTVGGKTLQDVLEAFNDAIPD